MSVSSQIEAAFQTARSVYGPQKEAWVGLSWKLAGRASLPPMAINVQRAGEFDLVLRGIEDETAAPQQSPQAGVRFTGHYLMMLSEAWVIAVYEILRALKQREREFAKFARAERRAPASDDISDLRSFRQIFIDLELLRMPIAKYEIAKDAKMESSLVMRAGPANGGPTDDQVYDKNDPARFHIMPSGLSARKSAMWMVLDHSVPKEYWVERRDLSDRILALSDEIEPAGLREARLAREAGSV